MDQLAVLSAVDLVAQVVDVHVNDVGERVEVLVPDVLGDHRAGQHAAGIAHQVFQEGILLGRQLDAPSPAGNLAGGRIQDERSEEHTSELQSRGHLVCRLLLEKKKQYSDQWR